MNNWLVKLVKPTLIKVFLFALVAAFCLIQQYQFNLIPGDAVCLISYKEQINIGYPFVYYIYGRGDFSELLFFNLLFNLALLYILACLVSELMSSIIRSFKSDNNSKKIIVGSILINAFLVSFVLIFVFGETMLMGAIQNQNYVNTRFLLNLGVPANNLTPNRETFALKEAARFANLDLTKLLVNAGADSNLKDRNGFTALQAAARSNGIGVVEFLLTNGAKVNSTSDNKKSALHHACSYKMVKLLTDSGADIKLKDIEGHTAKHYIKDKTTSDYLTHLVRTVQSDSTTTIPSKTSNDTKSTNDSKSTLDNSDNSDVKIYSLVKMVKDDSDLADIVKAIKLGANLHAVDELGKNSLYYALKACNVEVGKLIYEKSNFFKIIESNSVEKSLKTLISNKSICWEKISGIKNTITKLKEPSSSIQCTTKIGGNLIKNGKKQPIIEIIDKIKTIFRGSHGFLYANCKTTGFYHLVIQGGGGYKKSWENLYANPKQTDDPLWKKENDVVLVNFDLPNGEAILRWYFSTERIKDVFEAIKQDKLKKISFERVQVKSL